MMAWLLMLLATGAHAERVRIVVRPGIDASAEYAPGASGKPAVLLVHGFLQTRDFPTVATLANALADAGYPTLAPNLSLGIPNRAQSLACEAVHQHTMEGDSAEIAQWVGWLKARGHQRIVLIGHSFGSLNILAYLSGKPDPAVRGFIGASLIEAQTDERRRAELLATLRERMRADNAALVRAPLSFCKAYTATPASLLSYLQWDRQRTLAALAAHHDKAFLVMGGADERLSARWLEALGKAGARVKVIGGASHFLDGEHEFDLIDATLSHLALFDGKR